MHDRHTGQNLKEELNKLLKHFELEVWQIFSITIDNATNMVKLVRLFSQEAETVELNNDDGIISDPEWNLESAEEVEQLKNEADDDMLETTLETESYESPEEQTWAKVLVDATTDEFVAAIRCGAHTTQLVVHDVCREKQFRETLKEIRKKTKKFRSAEYKAFFEASEGAYPPLPNETRWNTDYRLMLALKNGKKFFRNLN